MATLEQIEAALRKADAAGNVEDARMLAQAYRDMKQATPAPETKSEGIGEQAARMGARALTGIGELAVDMPLSAGNWVGNKINDAIGQPHANFNTHPVRSMTDSALQQMGVNPQSSGAGENIAQAGISALTGAGLGKMAGSAILSAMPIRQTVGAVSGATANESLKDADIPEPLKMAASVGAGVAGSNIAGAVGGIGKGIGRAGYATLTDQGRREAAGRALYKQTSNPDIVIDRLKNADLRSQHVPNSAPITPEIGQDAGMSLFLRSLDGNARAIETGTSSILSSRISDLSSNVDKYLNRVNRNGTDSINILDDLQSSKLNPFLSNNNLRATPVDGANVISTLDDQFAKFAGNGKVEKFIEKSAKNLFPNAKIERVNGELKILNAGDNPNFNQAWNARKGLDDLLYDKKISLNSTAETKGAADVAGGAIRTSINDALKQTIPEFEDVLGTLAKSKKMQSALLTGRGLQEKMKLSGTTSAQNADDLTGVARYSPYQAGKIGKDLTNSRGMPSDLAQKMTKSQREAFNNVAMEMERSKALTDLGNTVNSSTAAYQARSGLLSSDILDSILGAQSKNGKPGLVRMAAEGLLANPLEKIGVTKPLEIAVMNKLKAGLIDPDEGLALLEMGRKTQRGLLDVGQGVKKSSQAGLLGALLAR